VRYAGINQHLIKQMMVPVYHAQASQKKKSKLAKIYWKIAKHKMVPGMRTNVSADLMCLQWTAIRMTKIVK
jgi:hypothetical protein